MNTQEGFFERKKYFNRDQVVPKPVVPLNRVIKGWTLIKKIAYKCSPVNCHILDCKKRCLIQKIITNSTNSTNSEKLNSLLKRCER